MEKNIVSIQKTGNDIVDGVIVSQLPLKVLNSIFRALDFGLFVSFITITGWLLNETDIHPMFGLAVFLMRFLWHGIDARVRKDLSVENPTKKSDKRG